MLGGFFSVLVKYANCANILLNFVAYFLHVSMKALFRLVGFLVVFALVVSCTREDLSGTEEQQIENYIKNNNLVVTEKTATGLRYILTKANPTGASIKSGQSVTVKYTGKLLTDRTFDAGTFSFFLGAGQVIEGFDEGIAKMKVGEKATLIFPSSLGYGSRGAGADIPGNSPLLFEIEVVSAK